MNDLEKQINDAYRKAVLDFDDGHHGCHTKEELITKACSEVAINLAREAIDWHKTLTPSQKCSVWSDDGSTRGLFEMSSARLIEKFLASKGIKKG